MSLRHVWRVVDLEKANTFPRRGKHKERYMKGGTLEEVAYKTGFERFL